MPFKINYYNRMEVSASDKDPNGRWWFRFGFSTRGFSTMLDSEPQNRAANIVCQMRCQTSLVPDDVPVKKILTFKLMEDYVK